MRSMSAPRSSWRSFQFLRPINPASASPQMNSRERSCDTFSLPEVAELRLRLVPELTILGSQVDGESEIIVSGVADAIAYDAEGRIETIVDWKSDVEFDAERLNSYCRQLDAYRRQTRARKALLVLMTSGTTMAL